MRVGSNACLFNLNSLVFIFFILLINQAAIFVMVEAGCTTSCGKLNNIYYPFRLRDDSKHCGDADYELVCESGEAVFYSGSHKYFVTQIEYPLDSSVFGGNMTIHMDCPFKDNTCRLHHNYYSNFIYNSRRDMYPSQPWVHFLRCSEKIENDSQFAWNISKLLHFPSLGTENTTNYLLYDYDYDTATILYLPKSCELVDTFLFPDIHTDINSSWQVIDVLQKGFPDIHTGVNSSRQVIDVLQKGFNISWPGYFLNTDKGCWTSAIWTTNVYIEDGEIPIASYPFNFLFNLFSCLSIKACQLHTVDDENKCHIIFENITSIPGYILVGLLGLAMICKFVLVPLTMYVYLMYSCWRNTKPVDSVEKFLRKQEVLLPRRYSYGEIAVMSNHFKEKLGKGGFGHVYKGELFGLYPVAIKILDGLQFNGEDFINEVSTIGMIHHVNIVQLIGFCSEGTKRALIYEYMPNGSLDKYIFSSDGTSCSLTLEKLDDIALGIAKGISYLHTGCDMQILHFDIKPHNILLDANFTPKISDFGLAKLYPKEQSLVSISAARGTIGYIAPELISRSFGVISHKSDVYSFGMLVLEIAGRRRNVDARAQNSKEVYFPSWIYDKLTHLEQLDINEIIEIGEPEKRLCKVGLWCIQMNSSKRPSMSEVVKFLESDAGHIEMPPKPFFLSTDATNEAHMSIHSSSLTLSTVVENDDLPVYDLV